MAPTSPSLKSVEELLADCIDCLERRKLTGALRAASAAVKEAESQNDRDGNLITSLDRRVDVLLEMHNEGAAFKGAESMIQQDPKDERGYIRCASLAEKQNSLPLAISYLERGLETVPRSMSRHGQLSQILADAQDRRRRQLTSQVKDPVAVLPTEIMGLVLSNLDYKQVVQMLQLSKSWSNILRSLPPLIDTLCLPGGSRRHQMITTAMVTATLARFKLHKSISVGNVSQHSAWLLSSAFQSFEINTIEHLDAGNWFIPPSHRVPMLSLKTILLSGETPIDWICALVRSCPQLKIAKFEHVVKSSSLDLSLNSQSLQFLTLKVSEGRWSSWMAPYRDQVIAEGQSITSMHEHFFFDLLQLRELSFTGFTCNNWSMPMDLRNLGALTSLTVQRSVLPNLCLPPSIETIHLEDCYFSEQSLDSSTFYSSLDNVKSLYLAVYDAPPQFIRQAATTTTPGTLENLNIQYDADMPDKLEQLLERGWFKGVKHFEINGPHLDDSFCELFIRCFPKMETLTLTEASEVTELLVAEIVAAKMPLLRLIDMSQPDIQKDDIIKWAAERGVEVVLRDKRYRKSLEARYR